MIPKYENSDASNKVRNSKRFSPAEREQMIVKYAYLVKHIASRIAARLPSSVVFDELISAGSLGLIDAVDKYDEAKDVTLKTYAQYRIKGAILDELRNMDWYSRSMRKKMQDIEHAIQAIELREGRPADEEEIAAQLGIELERYHKMLSDIHGAALLNLDAFIRNENGSQGKKTFKESMESPLEDPDQTVGKKELKKVLITTIEQLSEKEKMVISLYYYDELTLKEIGEVMELTESRVCQIHTMAILKMKTKMKTYLST